MVGLVDWAPLFCCKYPITLSMATIRAQFAVPMPGMYGLGARVRLAGGAGLPVGDSIYLGCFAVSCVICNLIYFVTMRW